MIRNKSAVPHFAPPPAENSFLASESALYDYSNLFGFTKWLNKTIIERGLSITTEHPLLIVSKSKDSIPFLIAGAFLLDLPIFPVNPKSTDSEIEVFLKQIKPGAVYTDQKKRFPMFKPDQILKLPKSSLQKEAGWDHELFTLENPESIAGYFSTSGSSSPPKIVPVKRRQVYFAANASAKNFKPDYNRYWLLCLPLNHVGGMNIIYRSLLYHSAIYRMDSFDVDLVRTFLSENKLFQAASMVPAMVIKLLEDPLFQIHNQFKAILMGGAASPSEFINRSVTRGIPIVSSYGMTETCAQIAANPLLKPLGVYIPKKSVGFIFAPNEIEIRDDRGIVQPRVESGQIWLKGPQVFDGYYNPELNKNAFDDNGWFNTGDYGHLNRLGQLFIENRRSDIIITGGENVNPVEVEESLNQLEEIKESAVTGIPDIEWGEKIVALIVPENGKKIHPDSIKSKLRLKLSAFKIPKVFKTIESLPKTALGKIKRNELQDFIDG